MQASCFPDSESGYKHSSNPLAEIIVGLYNISKQCFEFGPTGGKNSYGSTYALSEPDPASPESMVPEHGSAVFEGRALARLRF